MIKRKINTIRYKLMCKNRHMRKNWENGSFSLRSKLLIYTNPILRKIQWWSKRPFLIVGLCEWVGTEKPRYPLFKYYKIARIRIQK
ncbi:hypothetical protein [uncultured Arcobacter sp.]|uniref:hypothetical protein n=1 Tax=uncultured Arcobacter sp. TaxID=165434 RepID=UPI00262EDA02|nr:hypothetical protein [uncultured Arcobacter sp.]